MRRRVIAHVDLDCFYCVSLSHASSHVHTHISLSFFLASVCLQTFAHNDAIAACTHTPTSKWSTIVWAFLPLSRSPSNNGDPSSLSISNRHLSLIRCYYDILFLSLSSSLHSSLPTHVNLLTSLALTLTFSLFYTHTHIQRRKGAGCNALRSC